MTDVQTPQPGWYPAAHANGENRYWDGTRWLEPQPAAINSDKSKKKGLPWWVWVLIGVAALLILIIAIGSANARPAPAAAPAQTEQAVDEPAVVEEPAAVPIPDLNGKTVAEARGTIESLGLLFVNLTPESGDDWIVTSFTPAIEAQPGGQVGLTSEAPAPVLTLEQENALESARSYLQYSAFSRNGLIQQLSSEYGEGYPLDVATWAADAVGADWNAEAAESAKSYLSYSSFSRDGLYQQLTSEYGEGFTPDEANFGLAAVGY